MGEIGADTTGTTGTTDLAAIGLSSYDEIAAALAVPVRRVQQLIRDGHLIAVDDPDGRRVPTGFVHDGAVVKSLPGVITLLRDARFTDAEIVDWLHRSDDTLPGSPIEALRANRGTEVKRRAQVAGY